jgi:CubicO group peptidase (beta-lactamase class C family)
MNRKLRLLIGVAIISGGGLLATLVPTSVLAKATLQIVRGSGEFQTLETAITLSKPEDLTMQWTTDQAGATAGTWQVRNVTAGNQVVASGETPAPAVGHFLRFTIAANAFLMATPPASPVKFSITIVPHNAAKQPLGGPSAVVSVSQVPDVPDKPVVFGASAVFPTVSIMNYEEKIGVVPLTQLHFAGADVTVLVKNKGKTPTDPAWLNIKDTNLLMRQNTPVSVPVLKAGAWKEFTIHLDAVLPPPKSQLPEEVQYTQWNQWYRDRCGVNLDSVMDWRGPQAQTPIGDHYETALLPNTVCDSAQCVKPCQIANNIHKELDGHVVGYSFFVGIYPHFDAGGYARTSADAPLREFTPTTRITVASVSKIVTAIAAIRILAKHNVSLDATIENYLPSDWNVSNYVKNITFAQLLGQRSGIKDYGNVANDYATLKAFYSQSVSNGTATVCDPTDAKGNLISTAPGKGFTPMNKNWCYSNFNFAIMRILLPKVAGFPEDNNLSTRPQTLANQYVKLVQQNEFDLVGQNGVSCAPPSSNPAASSYSFAYKYPGSSGGFDWNDNSLICGAAGWYLTVGDIGRVLLSINARDGKIFSTSPDQFEDMRTRGLGLDTNVDTEMEKNGGWSANCDANGKNCATISTSVAIFGPVTGPRLVGVLFLNSNISGGTSNAGSAKGVLEKAYKAALYPK